MSKKCSFNPLSAMGDFRNHVIGIFSDLGVKELTYGLIARVKCSSERFTVAKSVSFD